MDYKDDFKNRFGVSVSTARYQLVKNFLFKLLVETNRDTCFRCSEKFTLKTMSIEHKDPWAWKQDAYDVFMDLDNIAFSHGACNSGSIRKTDRSKAAARNRSRIKVSGIECSRCEEVKSSSEFHKNKTTPTGHESLCKICRKETR